MDGGGDLDQGPDDAEAREAEIFILAVHADSVEEGVEEEAQVGV